MEIESKSFHKLWSCGSASTRGTNLNKTGDNAMQQVTNARQIIVMFMDIVQFIENTHYFLIYIYMYIHVKLYCIVQIFCGL